MRPTTQLAKLEQSIAGQRGRVQRRRSSLEGRLYDFWAQNSPEAPATPTRCQFYRGVLAAPKLKFSLWMRPVTRALEQAAAVVLTAALFYWAISSQGLSGLLLLAGKVLLIIGGGMFGVMLIAIAAALLKRVTPAKMGNWLRRGSASLGRLYGESRALLRLPVRWLYRALVVRRCPTVELN